MPTQETARLGLQMLTATTIGTPIVFEQGKGAILPSGVKKGSDEDMSGVVIVVIECIVSFGEENGGLSQIGVEAHPDYAGITGGQMS